MREEQLSGLVQTRSLRPEAIAEAAAARWRPEGPLEGGRAFVVAADHTARNMLGAGERPMAIVDRADMLDRLVVGGM